MAARLEERSKNRDTVRLNGDESGGGSRDCRMEQGIWGAGEGVAGEMEEERHDNGYVLDDVVRSWESCCCCCRSWARGSEVM